MSEKLRNSIWWRLLFTDDRESRELPFYKRKPELVAFCLFVVLYAVITAFHEPWFDEAQAWQIARCASYKNILFIRPHYEGHPPLWHLILSVPAKLGVPFEIGLKSVGFTFAAAYAFLIIFKSPFPRAVRLLLPFNYFLFYQFGVIVRPYGLMALLLILLAMAFPEKDSRPWKFVTIMMLLCFTHSYGILLCGGISMCWLWDIMKEKGLKALFSDVFKDKRERALSVLLLVAVLIIIEIFPYSDTHMAKDVENSVFLQLICTLFTMLPDCLVYTSGWFSYDTVLLRHADISLLSLIPDVLVGILLWGAIWLLGSHKNFKYYAVPYTLFAIFGAFVYMVAHHIGVALELFIFWLWVDLEAEDHFENFSAAFSAQKEEMSQSSIVTFGMIFVCSLCLLIPVYWSVYSSVNDIRIEYSYGRGTAAFLKETGLENTAIYVSWDSPTDSSTTATGTKYEDFVAADPCILAYFDRNLFVNVKDKSLGYREYRIKSEEEYYETIKQWSKLPIPDVIEGESKPEEIFGEEKITIRDYSIAYVGNMSYFFKDKASLGKNLIYVRNDIMEQYGLTQADKLGMIPRYYNIPESIADSFRKGEITSDQLMDIILGDFGKE